VTLIVDGSQPARQLVERIDQVRAERPTSCFVALDGRSGSGKSTLAASVARMLDASQPGEPIVTVIDGDQFYAGGSAQRWDERSPRERASQVIDWRRQREVLQALRATGRAEWYPFDWDADDWDTDIVPLRREPLRCAITPVVVLEGAYSARPELHDLLDLRVLVDTPTDVRLRRLLEREGAEYRADWLGRWSAAEDHYFGTVMPRSRFDVVVTGATADGDAVTFAP
jgi:uridine kinase